MISASLFVVLTLLLGFSVSFVVFDYEDIKHLGEAFVSYLFVSLATIEQGLSHIWHSKLVWTLMVSAATYSLWGNLKKQLRAAPYSQTTSQEMGASPASVEQGSDTWQSVPHSSLESFERRRMDEIWGSQRNSWELRRQIINTFHDWNYDQAPLWLERQQRIERSQQQKHNNKHTTRQNTKTN